MNAGFVGYYADEDQTGIDCALTMTVFVITDGQVEIKRFSSDGLHNLKSKGMLGCEYKDANGKAESTHYAANQTVYTSPQHITWEVEKPLTVTDATGTVTVTAPAITNVILASKTEQEKDGYAKYVVYDINVEGYTQGDNATVTIKLDDGFVANVPVTVIDLVTGEQTTKSIVNGAVTFKTDHLGAYAVGQADMSESVTDTKEIPVLAFEEVSSLEPGQYYVIVNYRKGYVLTSEASGNKLKLDTTADYSHVWYYAAENDNYYLRTNPTGSNNYLQINDGTAKLAENLFANRNSGNFPDSLRGLHDR
jgi:hypothetical protein